MEKAIFGLMLTAAVGSGLMAGVFFGFSVIVMPGLRRISPSAGIKAMQTINVVVINPWFMVVFMGTALVSLALAVAAFFDLSEWALILTVAGIALYLVGTFGVTMIFNVPLNNTLEAVDAGSLQGAEYWQSFLSEWTAWNTVRAVAALGASGAYMVALATR